MINIEGLDKAKVLKVLYDNSKPFGMGILHYNAEPMTIELARKMLEEADSFDYIKGRVMKINLKSDIEFEEWLYDRDNGIGKAKKLIDSIR